MPQPYFVKGLIGKVLAYGGLQIRTILPHGLQIHADDSALAAQSVRFRYRFRYLLFPNEEREMGNVK